MISQEDFLTTLIKKLDEYSIPYMLAGSVASSLHGQPRATRDVDIVIAATKEQVLNLVKALGENYYVSPSAIQEAFAHNSMFNVIDSISAWKADFIIRKNRPFSKSEFERKRIATIKGFNVWVASPEDTILSKLDWAKASASEQHFRDALGVAVVQYERLDMHYLHKWARELSVEIVFNQLLEQAKKQIHSE